VPVFAWGVILLLIAVNALYVVAEFSAVSVRRSQVHQLAQAGHPLARRLLPYLRDAQTLDRYIAACQIGITWSSLVLGAFGQSVVAPSVGVLLSEAAGWSESAGRGVAAVGVLVSLTTLQVVFGELVPKSLALQFPTPTALYTVLPMRWSLALYAAFIALLNGSGMAILRMLRMGSAEGHRHVHSPEEIELLIAESRDGGLLEPDEQKRLHHALHLGKITARQLMVPRRDVFAIDAERPVEQALRTAVESPFTRLPVYRESLDNIIGILHTKDVAARVAESGCGREAGPPLASLIRPATLVPGTVSAFQLLRTLRERHSRMAILLDEFGGMEGIVTLEDVLSELLGEIRDEIQGDEPAPERLPDGRLRLPGRMRLDEAAEFADVPLAAEEAETVAGFVLEKLGQIPEPGQRLQVEGHWFEVERMEDQAIVTVVMTPAPAADGK